MGGVGVSSVVSVLTSAVMSAALLPGPATAVPVAAPAEPPAVGECYDLPSDVLAAGGWWVDAEAVPCSEPHTFEVTESGPLPADVDAFAFAAERCGPLDVWTALGVNEPVAGIVLAPVRVEARSFAVRQGMPSYVCGAVVVSLNGRGGTSPVRLGTAIERLGPRARTALRYCASAADGRRARAPMITVPCTTRPRWEVAAWVVWSAFYDADPGRGILRARAAELCPPGAVSTLPVAADWATGVPKTWCFVRYP